MQQAVQSESKTSQPVSTISDLTREASDVTGNTPEKQAGLFSSPPRNGQYSRSELMRLQSVIGNQAVMRLIQQQKQGAMTKPSAAGPKGKTNVIQRDIGFEFEVPS